MIERLINLLGEYCLDWQSPINKQMPLQDTVLALRRSSILTLDLNNKQGIANDGTKQNFQTSNHKDNLNGMMRSTTRLMLQPSIDWYGILGSACSLEFVLSLLLA